MASPEDRGSAAADAADKAVDDGAGLLSPSRAVG